MEQLLEMVRNNDGVWALIALFAGSALEYLVPPLPGDTFVLLGALLIIAGTRSFATIFFVVVAGGFCGSMIHYALGRLLVRDGQLRGERILERLTGKGSLTRFFEVFRRRGVWVIAINRMLPAIRGVTFLAAGAARLPIVPTLLLGLVSNAVWTCALLFLGLALGGNWEKIQHALTVYSHAATAVVAAIAVLLVIRWVRKRRRVLGSRRREPHETA